jgi:hypothetical protein
LADVDRLAAKWFGRQQVPAEYHDVGETIEASLGQAVSRLQECHRFLSSDICSWPGDGVPVDASVGLHRAIKSVEGSTDREVTVRGILPEAMGDVLANPQLVPRVFETVLEYLLSDARDGSEITVTAHKGCDELTFTLQNQGVGASAELLREILHDDQETRVDVFRRLREVRDWVQRWGGRMVVSADENKGIVVKLVLRLHEFLGGVTGPEVGRREKCDPDVSGRPRHPRV